jgi:hypothetical protein
MPAATTNLLCRAQVCALLEMALLLCSTVGALHGDKSRQSCSFQGSLPRGRHIRAGPTVYAPADLILSILLLDHLHAAGSGMLDATPVVAFSVQCSLIIRLGLQCSYLLVISMLLDLLGKLSSYTMDRSSSLKACEIPAGDIIYLINLAMPDCQPARAAITRGHNCYFYIGNRHSRDIII